MNFLIPPPTLKNAREDPGVVSQDRKSSRTGGRLTSFDCRLKVTYMFMTLATSCFSLLLLYLGNSQVSVYRTIGPTLVW